MKLTFIKQGNEYKVVVQFEPYISSDKTTQKTIDVYIEDNSNRLYAIFGKENVFICTNYDEVNIVN